MNLYVFGLVLLVLTVIFFKRTINILNPIVLYCVVWGTMIFLYLIPLFTSFPSITPRKWLIIVGTVVLFSTGSLLVTSLVHVQNIKKNYVYNLKIIQYIVCCFYSICCDGYSAWITTFARWQYQSCRLLCKLY